MEPLRPRSPSPRRLAAPFAVDAAVTAAVPEATRRPFSLRAVVICAAAEVMFTLGGAVAAVPWTRLLESAVCRRQYVAGFPAQAAEATTASLAIGAGSWTEFWRGLLGSIGLGDEMDETLCKGDNVQAEIAQLMGLIASFAIVPGLLLTIPYSIIAKSIDRRIILVLNILSTVAANLFMILITSSLTLNLRLLWLTGLFDLVGGGSPVFLTLLRSIVAESVEANRLSSILYRISALHMTARWGGMFFGAWIMQFGAAFAMILAATVTSSIIPILCFLPRAAARAPAPAQPLRSSTEIPTESSSTIRSDDASPLLGRERSAEGDLPGQDPGSASDREPPLLFKSFGRASRAIVRRLSHIPFDNPLFPTCLIVIFLNGFTTEIRGQIRLWTSKRYDWSLATVSYILSAESLLGVGLLFVLSRLDRARTARTQPDTPAADHDEDSEGDATREAARAKRRHELLVARVSLVLGAAGALVLMFATSRGAFAAGLAVLTGSVGFPDAMRAFFTSNFAAGDIQGLYASVSVVDTLSIIVGSPVSGRIYAEAYRGGSAWIGAPFGVCAVLMLCTLGLVLCLRV